MLALCLSGSPDCPELVVESVDAPSQHPGRVIVDVSFAGVTKTEPRWSTNWLASGRPRSRPLILGLEFAGTVRAVGDGVQRFIPGQRVFGSTEPDHCGATAEQVSVAASMILETPARVSDMDASVLGLAGATAWQAIIRYGEVERGQRVLIHGGSGGVGAIATQLASWRGADVTVTAAREHAALCKTLGADRVIDYQRDRFEDLGESYDLVFDQVGADVLERSWGVIKRGGRLITIAGEQEPDQKRARTLGVTAKYFVFDSNLEELKELAFLVAERRILPVVGRQIGLKHADQAFASAPDGRPGKTVVACQAASH